MLGVAPCPTVVLAGPPAKFINDLQSCNIKWILIVGQVRPQATSGGLVKVPMCSFDRFNGQLDAGSTVPHVDVESGEGCAGVLTVFTFQAM